MSLCTLIGLKGLRCCGIYVYTYKDIGRLQKLGAAEWNWLLVQQPMNLYKP